MEKGENPYQEGMGIVLEQMSFLVKDIKEQVKIFEEQMLKRLELLALYSRKMDEKTKLKAERDSTKLLNPHMEYPLTYDDAFKQKPNGNKKESK